MRINVRMEPGVAMLLFETVLPHPEKDEGKIVVEAVRVLTTLDHMGRMASALKETYDAAIRLREAGDEAD